jgi:hypothetical protein
MSVQCRQTETTRAYCSQRVISAARAPIRAYTREHAFVSDATSVGLFASSNKSMNRRNIPSLPHRATLAPVSARGRDKQAAVSGVSARRKAERREDASGEEVGEGSEAGGRQASASFRLTPFDVQPELLLL